MLSHEGQDLTEHPPTRIAEAEALPAHGLHRERGACSRQVMYSLQVSEPPRQTVEVPADDHLGLTPGNGIQHGVKSGPRATGVRAHTIVCMDGHDLEALRASQVMASLDLPLHGVRSHLLTIKICEAQASVDDAPTDSSGHLQSIARKRLHENPFGYCPVHATGVTCNP